MINIKYPIALVAVFLWIGFVCAISFMEAWLKFRAPGINLALGLGIGRLVFNALNKVEWVFAIAIAANFLLANTTASTSQKLFYLLPFLILVLQTIWLLPALDARAELHIQAQEVPPSNLHFYYVGAELIKVISLILLGITFFKSETL